MRLNIFKVHAKGLVGVDWEEYYGFIVAAANPHDARKLAHEAATHEQRESKFFLDPGWTTCSTIGTANNSVKEPCVFLGSNKGS